MMDGDVAFWNREIEQYEKSFSEWAEKSKKIVERYRNDKKNKQNRFNILYSNIQTLAPALYSQQPKPNFERRFSGDDSVGRVASLVLERAVSYYIDSDDFDDCLQQTVLDRLLSGRGTSWLRYEIGVSEQVSDDISAPIIEYEDAKIDYVHWQDFGHTYGRTWQEVRAVWRKVPMSRKELVKRFGEIGNSVPLGDDPNQTGELEQKFNSKAWVYEIWDKATKQVFWLAKGMENLLDKKQDPLGLKGFFPCPRPLYSQLGNDSLKPTPDYLQYQDQATELDMITTRIDLIVKAIRVSGIYDASAEALKRLLSENAENKMIPVENWAMYAEKGGLKNAVSFFPLGEVVATLQQLYQSRESIKQTIYEITGISDIVRGSSVASETATAQNIKSQYATMRLGKAQRDVQRFCRDIIRILAEIIAEQFSIETIKQVSGVELFTEAEKQQYMMMAQMGQAQPDPKVERLMMEPTWEQVDALLKDNMARCFRIDIETDSTIKADQDAEKSSRAEFLTAVSQYLVQAANIQEPEMKPLLLELMRFGVQGFRVGKTMEAEFNMVIDKARKAALQPPPPQADPAQAEMQAEQMRSQAQMEIEKMKLDTQMQIEQMKLQSSEAIKMADIQARNDMEVIKARSTMSADALAVEDGKLDQAIMMIAEMIQQMNQNMIASNQAQAESNMVIAQGQAQLLDKMNQPKVATIMDASGKVVRTGTIQ